MEAKRLITSRQLPKTGAVTPVTAGHDGFYQAGWWRGRKIEGNKTRFISKTIDGDDVVIDRATGLMWAADGTAAGCFNGGTKNFADAITYAEGLTFAGFTDWRMPNVFELFSIYNMSRNSPAIDVDFFPNCSSNRYWTSTSEPQSATYKAYIDFDEIYINGTSETYEARLRCVRGGL